MTTRIRPLERRDVEAVAALRYRLSRESYHPPVEEGRKYFEEVFLDNPWADEELPSLVYDDPRDGIVGFLGVVPRQMTFQGRPIKVAVSTKFVVSPERRGLTGLLLMRRLFQGPQDLTYSDVGNQSAVRLFLGHGGSLSYARSLTWLKPLQPLWFNIREARALAKGPGRVLRRSLRPLAMGLDGLRSTKSRSPTDPNLTARSGNVTQALDHFEHWTAGVTLRPLYSPETLRWLLDQASRSQSGSIQEVIVMDNEGEPVGWFVYLLNTSWISQTVQVAARPGWYGRVLDELFQHARRGGAVAIKGPTQPEHLPELTARGCRFRCGVPWVLLRTRDAELSRAIHAGDAYLSPLDGEWWMAYF